MWENSSLWEMLGLWGTRTECSTWDTSATAARDACYNADPQAQMQHGCIHATAPSELMQKLDWERFFITHTAKSHQIYKIYTSVPTASWGQPSSATAIGNSRGQLWPWGTSPEESCFLISHSAASLWPSSPRGFLKDVITHSFLPLHRSLHSKLPKSQSPSSRRFPFWAQK